MSLQLSRSAGQDRPGHRRGSQRGPGPCHGPRAGPGAGADVVVGDIDAAAARLPPGK